MNAFIKIIYTKNIPFKDCKDTKQNSIYIRLLYILQIPISRHKQNLDHLGLA